MLSLCGAQHKQRSLNYLGDFCSMVITVEPISLIKQHKPGIIIVSSYRGIILIYYCIKQLSLVQFGTQFEKTNPQADLQRAHEAQQYGMFITICRSVRVYLPPRWMRGAADSCRGLHTFDPRPFLSQTDLRNINIGLLLFFIKQRKSRVGASATHTHTHTQPHRNKQERMLLQVASLGSPAERISSNYFFFLLTFFLRRKNVCK